MRHGGGAPLDVGSTGEGTSETAAQAAGLATAEVASARVGPGLPYINFFGEPSGKDRFGALADGATLAGMLERLTLRMYSDTVLLKGGGTNRIPAGKRADNPKIPSGFTYLGQMIAHDIAFTRGVLPRTLPEHHEVTNIRTRPLLLQCIYGEGPELNPWLYEIPRDSIRPRKKLRIGRAQLAGHCPALTDDFRDLPRATTERLAESDQMQCRYDPVIADGRNEDNLVVGQLVVLFHRLHNRIIDRLDDLYAAPASAPRLVHWQADAEQFEIARALTLACYRAAIRHDYLPRLLDKTIRKAYAHRPIDEFRPELFGKEGFLIPFEFTLGALRAGHAMVRAGYDFNSFHGTENLIEPVGRLSDILAASGAEGENQAPLRRDWIIDWDRFFGSGRHVNASRRLSPTMAGPLRHQVDTAFTGGLFEMDFRRSLIHPVRTVASLIDRFKLDKVCAGYPLADSKVRRQAIRARLTVGEAPTLPARDVETLSKDPPLLFYVLFEAEHLHNGECLGPLGSILLAEVLYGALLATEKQAGQVSGTIARAVFDGDIPDTMTAIKKFVGA
ncbi:peroxidase family protein [Oceanibacterium hippocampi]|uniref:Animal heme peroxidase n=1 Tax=Oceanibacterium hippocampi TaxID=745714 RepID=A0A1Y5TXE4_9PROT|nr:peroxidase family protein [Oceanibacterium hippocampi]SLN76093.1 Animal heme peroxidase [Oceanibacterium hippocampi]